MDLLKRFSVIWNKKEDEIVSKKNSLSPPRIFSQISYQDLKELSYICKTHDITIESLQNELETLKSRLDNEEFLLDYMMKFILCRLEESKSNFKNNGAVTKLLEQKYVKLKTWNEIETVGVSQVNLNHEKLMLDEKFRHNKIVENLTTRHKLEVAQLEEEHDRQVDQLEKNFSQKLKLETEKIKDQFTKERELDVIAREAEFNAEISHRKAVYAIKSSSFRCRASCFHARESALKTEIRSLYDLIKEFSNVEPISPKRKTHFSEVIFDQNQLIDISVPESPPSNNNDHHDYLKNHVQMYQDSILQMYTEIENWKSKYQEEVIAHKLDVERVISNTKSDMDLLIEKRSDEERLRRELHNQVMELKGNIRVYCRFRPAIKGEENEQQLNVTFENEGEFKIHQGNKESKFEFNRVYPTKSSQEDVFAEISGLVQSAVRSRFKSHILDGWVQSLYVCIWTIRKRKDTHHDRNKFQRGNDSSCS
jgi:hypothetical protein